MLNNNLVHDAWINAKFAAHDDRGGSSNTPEQGPMLDKILTVAIKQGASDVHLNVGKKPLARKDGVLIQFDTKVLSSDDVRQLYRSCAPNGEQNTLDTRGSCDFAFSFQDLARFRVNACKSQGDIKITLRRLPKDLLTPEQIGLTPQVMNCLSYDRGLVLVTGPTGSGKTTTLAAMMTTLLQNDRNHVYCIEDPTEYKLRQGKGLLTQREVGLDTPSFEQGLFDALRSNPNVIVVGEMRTKETIETALMAAETGHLVLATLHTTSASTTVERIVDTFPGNEKDSVRAMLAGSIRGIICQQLLPKINGGMSAAYEFLSMTPAIAHKIRQGDFHNIISDIQTGGKLGMRTLDRHLRDLCAIEAIEPRDAYMKANNKEEFIRSIQQVPALKDKVAVLINEFHKNLSA